MSWSSNRSRGMTSSTVEGGVAVGWAGVAAGVEGRSTVVPIWRSSSRMRWSSSRSIKMVRSRSSKGMISSSRSRWRSSSRMSWSSSRSRGEISSSRRRSSRISLSSSRGRSNRSWGATKWAGAGSAVVEGGVGWTGVAAWVEGRSAVVEGGAAVEWAGVATGEGVAGEQ